jgi:hypothetical protein
MNKINTVFLELLFHTRHEVYDSSESESSFFFDVSVSDITPSVTD